MDPVPEETNCCRRCCANIWLFITIAAIGVFVGILAGVMFAAPPYNNYSAAAFAFISMIFAGITLWIHLKHKNGTLPRWLPYLRGLMLLGCFGQLAGVVSMAAFIALGIVLHQGLVGDDIYGENYWISLVWGWMTWKWGFSLFWFSRKYKRIYESTQLITSQNDKKLYDADNPIVVVVDGEMTE